MLTLTLIYYSILQEELQPVRLAYQLVERVLPYSQPNPNEPSNQNQLTALQEAGELIRQHMVENAKVFHNKITQCFGFKYNKKIIWSLDGQWGVVVVRISNF